MDMCWTTIGILMGIVCAIKANSERITYKGFQVYSVQVDSKHTWTTLQNFINSFPDEIDVWKWPEALSDSVHVLLSPGQILLWDRFCEKETLHCSVMIRDVHRLIEEEIYINNINRRMNMNGRYRRDTKSLRHRLDGYYPTFSEIETWLHDLDEAEPLVTLKTIGNTHENRNLYLVEITANEDPSSTPAILLDFGMHAREWVAYSSGIFFIRDLLDGYDQNTLLRSLLDDVTWYVIPAANPDGYVYSHTTNRYWRKNRAPLPVSIRDGYNNTACIGIDLNRNWDFHWNEVGASRNSCRATYPGSSPMSELEVIALREFILNNTHNEQTQDSIRPGSGILAYATIHAYGQMILTRWSYTNDTPSDHMELMGTSEKIANAMKDKYGTTYKYGPAPRILYAYSGGSPDWAKAVAGIKYSYGIELRDKGKYGFVLPIPQINPVGEEIFRGLIVLGSRVLDYSSNITEPIEDDMTTDTDDSVTTVMVISKAPHQTHSPFCHLLCNGVCLIFISYLSTYFTT